MKSISKLAGLGLALWLGGCVADGSGETAEGGDAAGGGSGETPDTGITLPDGTIQPPPADAAVEADRGAGGSPDTDGGPPADLGRPDVPVTPPDARVDPDAARVAACPDHEVVDLNAWLADHAAYDGTTAGAPEGLAASCGGAAGGEIVFSWRVDRPLDRLVFRTDHPETAAATVVYVRLACDQPMDLACNRGSGAAPGTRASLDGVVPGLYYVVVDTGARDGGGAFRLTVDETGASACRDTDDNDADGVIDLADPGCTEPADDSEQDPPVVPACADLADNDSDGLVDYPNDPDCAAAGGEREGPLCDLGVPMTDVDVNGGVFPTNLPIPGGGIDAATGRCVFEALPEHLFVLTLDREADVRVINRSLNEARAPVYFYARREACDDPMREIGCADLWQGNLALGALEPGVYFIFAEYSQNGGRGDRPPPPPVPLGGGVQVDIEFVIRPTNPVCSDALDNDRDGLTDLADPGCRDARDEDEADPAILPFCANGQDDDADGLSDYPDDDGCTGAGDACEEVGFDFCDGRCQDVVSNAAHCGRCDNVCDEGVECIGGVCGGLFVFSGYIVDTPAEALGGWRECFVDGYGMNTPTAAMRQACDGELILMGCRPAGSDRLQLAAMGEAAEVFFDTGDAPDGTHEHNGVNWYYSEQSSVGFVPAGAVASRNSCDTNALPDWGSPDDGTGEGRLCWHTSGASFNQGFRCGLNVAYDDTYERVVFTSEAAHPVRQCNDGRDNDEDGRVDDDDPECEGPLDGSEAPVLGACQDLLDDDGDGEPDVADPGCRSPWDPTEDGRAAVAACGNGEDDDEDGTTDFPEDPDCRAAGDESEAPRCAAEADVIEVGQDGGDFPVLATDGNEGQAGSCGDGRLRAQVFALTLTDPSSVEVSVDANGAPVAATVHVRSACDDAETELACGATNEGPVRLRFLDRGTYYVFVEQGAHRAEWTAHIRAESLLRQCNDEVDNDRDERLDAADPGCSSGLDDNEGDDPAEPAECSDGIDNDDSGVMDWPNDANCDAAGDDSERLLCRAPYDLIPVGPEGGVFPVDFSREQGLTQGSCGDGPVLEQVFVLRLDRPSRVRAGLHLGPVFGNGILGTTYVRAACDDARSELACDGENVRGLDVSLARLEPGEYFVFAEFGFNWNPDDPNVQPEMHISVESLVRQCNDGEDNDADGRTDADDLGCARELDDDESDDPAEPPVCSDGLDNDMDGLSDYPADPNCATAGGGFESGCNGNALWQPVQCQIDSWVWSSDSQFGDLESANANRVLWSGCNHDGQNPDGLCSLDGTGWVSVDTFPMVGCDQSWWHIGGSFTGQCGGHDGDTVRHLALGENDCWDYR